MNQYTISIETITGLRTGAEAWEMYQATFAEIDGLAVQRHLMTSAEFYDTIHNPKIHKYVARDATGRVIGLGVQTNHLDEWPLISPRYFERHFPAQYERCAIWYVGFVCVAATAQGSTLFRDLIVQMAEPAVRAGGMSVMDFCAYNAFERRLPRAAQALLKRAYPEAYGVPIDAQQFWAWMFGGGGA